MSTGLASATDAEPAPAPPAGGPWRRAERLVDAGLEEHAVTWRELLVIGVLLSVVALALFARHAVDAGFYSDDWAYRTAWWTFDAQGGFSRAFDLFWNSTLLGGRPVLAAYLSVQQALFGDHQGWYLAWAIVLAVLLSASFYLFLRTVGIARLHAAVLSLLVLVFPASDSARIWAIISDAQVAMSACLLGAVLALWSLQRTGRAMVALRVGSLALFAISILTYELTTAAIAASAIVYRRRVPWRRALKAGALDVALVAVLWVTVKRDADTERLGFSAAIDHGSEVAKQVVQLFISDVLALGNDRLIAFVPIILLLAAAAVVYRRLPERDQVRDAVRHWLLVLAAAVAMVVAAYVIYAPAATFYLPLAPGLLNRTNAFGALPLVVAVYALGALAGVLLFRGLPGGPRLAGLFAVLAGIGLGIGYTVTLHRHVELWDSAYKRGQQTLSVIKGSVPKPSANSLLVAYGQPIEEAPGIPVWEHSWDLDGAVRLMWQDTTLKARPAFPGTTIECGRDNAGPRNPAAGSVYLPTDTVPYGKLILVDTSTGRFSVPRSRRQCREEAPTFVPGPFYTPAELLP
jgi:hypothetical protein